MRSSLIRRTLPTLVIVLASLGALAAHLSAPRIERLAQLRIERERLAEQVDLLAADPPRQNLVAAHDPAEIEPLMAELQGQSDALTDPNAAYDALADLIRRIGLEIESASPHPGEELDSGLRTFGWSVVAIGSFDKAAALLDALHELPGLTRLASMRLAPAPAGTRADELVLHLIVEFVRMELPDQLVDAARRAAGEAGP